MRIIDLLNSEGFFDEDNYCLRHMNFEPRNILIHMASNLTASLSRIPDWDKSVFAPAFVSCRVPSWLCDFEGDDDEELNESIDPQDTDLLAIESVRRRGGREVVEVCL
jgi:hypothetical protein